MPLTIKQFNKLATKDDLKDLRKEMIAKSDLKIISSKRLKRSDVHIDLILNKLKNISKDFEDIKKSFIQNRIFHEKMSAKIESLEKRVIKLEIKASIKATK
jgi:hypothetical protein